MQKSSIGLKLPGLFIFAAMIGFGLWLFIHYL
jgi:hypothetical protein